MSLITSPQYFGIQDAIISDNTPFGVRIYYPTEDDVIVGAPLAPGPHPLVVFAHGSREVAQNALFCPANPANDYKRWTVWYLEPSRAPGSSSQRLHWRMWPS